MYGKAVSVMGCTQYDAACYCSKDNFYYGLRDCSGQACGTDQQNIVLDWLELTCSEV